MKKSILISLMLAMVSGSLLAQAPLTVPVDLEKTPWLKGVSISPHPTDITPVIPMSFYLENGEPIPATLTEDVSFSVFADSAIFDEMPPAVDGDKEIPDPKWAARPVVNWHVIDWECNKNIPVQSTEELSMNQMTIKPIFPTGKGAITCHIGRRMSYALPEPGRRKAVYANSSRGADVRVLDITPPTCGLNISVKDGPSGAFWAVENPPDKYPLPKLADILMTGELFGEAEFSQTQPENELGADIIVSAQQGAIHVNSTDELSFEVLGGDNYKLDNDKLRYGICDGAGGSPVSIGGENLPVMNLSEIKMPKNPFIFIEAVDVSGNKQVIFVPMIVK